MSGIQETIIQQRKQMKDKSGLTNEERMLGLDTDPLIKQYGGCIESFTISKGFQNADALLNAAQALKAQDLKPEEQDKKLQSAANAINNVIKNLRSVGTDKEEKARYGPSLELLKSMIAGPNSETPKAKAAFNAAEKKRNEDLKACEARLKILDAHPIIETNPFPSGRYRLFAIPEGRVSIPILDIEVN